VTVTGSVCGFVKVTEGETSFWHTVTPPDIEAVGVGRTVTIAEPVIIFEHDGAAW
jgi:hypothetical protein